MLRFKSKLYDNSHRKNPGEYNRKTLNFID